MNDIEKKLEALKAEFLGKLEALRKEAEAQKKQEEPKLGEKYFYISQSGRVILDTFTQHTTDFARKNFGNFFRTRERVEQVKEKMRMLLRLEQLHDMLCPDYEPDWGSGEAMYCLYYDHSSSRWAVDGWYDCNCRVNGAYFDTKENADKAAEILNKELEESE